MFADITIPAGQVIGLWITSGLGLFLSSVAIVWDIVKHNQQKAKLRIDAKSGMKLGSSYSHFNISAAEAASLDYISITVTNIGDKTTTVTNLALAVFANRFMYWFNRPSVTFIISLEVKEMPLPHTLETGKPCGWVYEENKDVMSQAKGKLLYVIVSHSMSTKQCYSRVR